MAKARFMDYSFLPRRKKADGWTTPAEPGVATEGGRVLARSRLVASDARAGNVAAARRRVKRVANRESAGQDATPLDFSGLLPLSPMGKRVRQYIASSHDIMAPSSTNRPGRNR